MRIVDALPDFNERAFMDDRELRAVAREMMRRLDMTVAAESDYAEVIELLRDVHNAGRARGLNESDSGCMG